MNKICVLGLGYIGLPTALMLASHGIDVVGVDTNPSIIASLKQGKVTFEEEGLDKLFQAAATGGIEFQSDPISTDIYIITVPTPYDKCTKRVEPNYVVGAVRDVLKVCPKDAVIVIESTISPGTIDKYIRPIVAEHTKEVHLVHAPERIIPGKMIYELEYNSRTIGADSPAIAKMVELIYTSFCKGEIVLTDIRSAEMAKVVENTFRDINIAFANELAKICREAGMDVYEIIRIANMHPRVNILQPGPGVGGHCISVDPWFLVGDFPQLSLLIHEARKINDSMPLYVLERLQDVLNENHIKDVSRIGFYGLTYKEDVDDTRESPSLQLFESVQKGLGAPPKVFDPMVRQKLFPSQYDDFDKFMADVDVVVIMVGHSPLREHIQTLDEKIVLDTRNVCQPRQGVYKL
jgi:UDP-N-acetyl-D-mannosaminuronic acid dehydrogenase